LTIKNDEIYPQAVNILRFLSILINYPENPKPYGQIAREINVSFLYTTSVLNKFLFKKLVSYAPSAV
jgi:hypothetical protein